jgi:membrane protein YdbS with pleckstrin-like domain
MKRGVQIAIAIVLLLIVAAVLISPTVDLAPTAMRAALWSLALLASIAAVTVVFSGFRPTSFGEPVRTRQLRLIPKLIPLIDLDCARLC